MQHITQLEKVTISYLKSDLTIKEFAKTVKLSGSRVSEIIKRDLWRVEQELIGFSHIGDITNPKNRFSKDVWLERISKGKKDSDRRNYKRLYDMICDGESVPCFVNYKISKEGQVFRDVAKVRKRKDGEICIDCRGIEYGNVYGHAKGVSELKAFIEECKDLDLEFFYK